MACTLDYDSTSAAYWSCSPRDKDLGAYCDAFATQFIGILVCHLIYAYEKFIWDNPSLCTELGTIKADMLTYSTYTMDSGGLKRLNN